MAKHMKKYTGCIGIIVLRAIVNEFQELDWERFEEMTSLNSYFSDFKEVFEHPKYLLCKEKIIKEKLFIMIHNRRVPI